MYNLLVSFNAPDHEKETIDKTVRGFCTTSYLLDIPHAERARFISGADILLSWNPSMEYEEGEFALMGNAKLLQLVSAGADHLPFEKLKTGMIVAGNSGAYAMPMAEHVMAMMLALLKKLVLGHKRLSEGVFEHIDTRMLAGLSCGILGYGGIGKAVACYLRAFHVKVLVINTSGTTDEDVAFSGTLRDLDCVLSQSDIVVVSLPLTRRTRGIIGKSQLDAMKKDAVLINVARGEIIDEGALYGHLKANPYCMAGIDAWWVEPFRHGEFRINYPFFELPNVLGSPHNSSIVPQVIEMGVHAALENIIRFAKREKLKGVVDFEDYIDPKNALAK